MGTFEGLITMMMVMMMIIFQVDELRQHVGDVLLQEYSWHHNKVLVEKIKARFPPEEPTTCPPKKKGNDRRQGHYDILTFFYL